MNFRIKWIPMLLSLLLGKGLDNGGIAVRADESGNVHITAAAAKTPLLADVAELSTLTVGGSKVAFGPCEVSGRAVSDAFGKGSSYVLEAESEEGIVRVVTITAYDRYPSTLVVRAAYENHGDIAAVNVRLSADYHRVPVTDAGRHAVP